MEGYGLIFARKVKILKMKWHALDALRLDT